jgi:hypothetical protein
MGLSKDSAKIAVIAKDVSRPSVTIPILLKSPGDQAYS